MMQGVQYTSSSLCTVICVITSELDDVIVEFLAGMVCSDETDVEQLIEILNAYIPQLGEIERYIETIDRIYV